MVGAADTAGGTAADMSEFPTRRERMRAMTLQEIRTTARELLVELGHSGLTTRAVARRMRISSPALYRYFASHDELKDALLAQLFDELSVDLRSEAEACDPSASPLVPLVTASRALRRWALQHPREFEFMLVHPMGDPRAGVEQVRARREFGGVMLSLVAAAVRSETVVEPQPPAEPEAVEAMVRYCANCGVTLSPEVAPVALQCWVRLYGAVSMVTMGQLEPLGVYAETVFEQELDAMARILGHPGLQPA